jgi:thioester reductase-like protein
MVLEGMPLDANGKINRKALLASIPQALVQDEVVRPANQVEEMLVTVFAQVLSLPKETVSVTADLFQAYGANSLTVAQFVSEARRIGNVGEMSMRDVFTTPTLRQLSSMIIEKSTRAPANLCDEFCKEVKHLLDGQTPDLSTKTPSSAKMPTVLVTGATGYLGCHVLHRLLKTTKGISIMLLVRANDETEALERIHTALASNELLSGRIAMQVKERCKMICGDLSLPNLGLKGSYFLQVGKQISAIVHCGAKVHHLASYDSLKPTNVNGTKEILRLSAATGSPIKTPVLYMSTTGVFGGQTKDGAVNIMEDDHALNEHDKLSSGYAQSKWVAEQLCRGVQQQGWPVCILRVGFLVPRMGHQVWQERSTASAMLASFRMLGVFPADISLSVTTVDFAARATVHILQHSMGNHRDKLWTTFHLCDPPSSQVGASTAHQWLLFRGRPTQKVSFKEYLTILSEKAMSCSDPMVAANLTNLEQVISHHGANLVFDNSRLVGILKSSGIKLPRMSLRRFLKLYDSSQLFVQAPRGGTCRRSKVAQLHVSSLLSGVHRPSLWGRKRAKRDMRDKHVLTSIKNNETTSLYNEETTLREGVESAGGNASAGDTGSTEPDSNELADTKLTLREGVQSAGGNVSAGDTGSTEPDSNELADTKLKHKCTERMVAILRRRKENKQKEQAMTGALNDAVTALTAASGKRAVGIDEELASLKSDMKKLMSMVEQITSRQAKDDD